MTHSPLRHHWQLDPDISFLNHGSFGACPIWVLEAQRAWRDRLEWQPISFFVRDLESHLDAARETLAEFVGAEPADLAWTRNATHGVNSVLQSLEFRPDDELLTISHAYNACRNALQFVADRAADGRTRSIRIVTAPIAFPNASPAQVVSSILEHVTSRTRLVMIDHVTSSSGLVLPIEAIVRALPPHVEILVDGAHAPGMISLDLSTLGATYYAGNCHKWMCGPKGCGFLYVRRDRQSAIRPPVISHGANAVRSDRSRFLMEFDWEGTHDPTAVLSVPNAIRFMDQLLPGGWTDVRDRNRQLALQGRQILCDRLSIAPPCPEEMIGSLVSLPLPGKFPDPERSHMYIDPLQEQLWREERIEVPIFPTPEPGQRNIRISAQLYNHVAEYERLADALVKSLSRSPVSDKLKG